MIQGDENAGDADLSDTPVRRRAATVLAVLYRIEAVVVPLLLTVALGLYLFGILARTLSQLSSAEWTEELTIFLVMWSVLLAVGGLTSRGGHVTTRVLIDLFPPKWQRGLEKLGLVATLMFCLVLLFGSYKVIDLALFMDERGVSSLRIPLVWYYAALPVSMVLALLHGMLALTFPALEPTS